MKLPYSVPKASGIILKVLEIPSFASLNLILETLSNEARAPLLSRQCIGFAPGAKGSPFLRPSGVVPVFLP